jgi:hypothetical protein
MESECIRVDAVTVARAELLLFTTPLHVRLIIPAFTSTFLRVNWQDSLAQDSQNRCVCVNTCVVYVYCNAPTKHSYDVSRFRDQASKSPLNVELEFAVLDTSVFENCKAQILSSYHVPTSSNYA